MRNILFLIIMSYGVILSNTVNAKSMVGAYIQGNGYRLEKMTAFEADINKDLAIINLFTSFDYDWHTLRVQNANIIAQGATPMITLEPTLALRHNDNLLPEIIAGDWDEYLDNWIADFKIWIEDLGDPNAKVLLRFAHEFNGIWYPWSNYPTHYILAWRYLHERFEMAGANQYVEWVWNANNVDVDDYDDITLYYPGDDVVDWTSIDGYNWGSNFSFSQWNTFAELFEEKYALLMSKYPNKPIIIAEIASAEPSDIPDLLLGQDGDDSDSAESKALWIKDMFKQLRTHFRGIKGIVWFNINKELSWSINEADHNTGLTKFKKKVKRQYYISEFRMADSFVRNGMLKGLGKHQIVNKQANTSERQVMFMQRGHRVKGQAAGFRQMKKAMIEQRRKQHHKMIAEQVR
ncbi:glycosyl hydrolase [uncultured Shewanella sp.]|uniref:glycoside hydrolase family 26 protein n=1 Tax=uncultured Shewanella sp. TaxID=173975 RepID=UPI00262B8BD3|nr:glycosyl hydrolase [uncultured Shewanella sp.]